MRRYLDGDAGVIIRPIAAIAGPFSTGMVEIGIGRHIYAHTGLSNLAITSLACPSSSIRTACRVSIIRRLDGVAGARVRPKALFALPAYSIAGRACVFRYISSVVPGEQGLSPSSQDKCEREEHYGNGSFLLPSRHGALMPLDISSQTTKATDSVADININTCLVDLNVLSVMMPPCYAQENTLSLKG